MRKWVSNLTYNLHTGELSSAYKCNTFGYLMVRNPHNGVPERAHRLVWEKEVGRRRIPEGFHIDHINGVKDDNRLCNLRLATNQQNSSNREIKPMSNIDLRGGNYRVKICVNYKTLSLGTYNTLEEAQKVRDCARVEYFGEFNGRKEER